MSIKLRSVYELRSEYINFKEHTKFHLCLVPIPTGAGGTSSSVDSLKNISKLGLVTKLGAHKLKLTEVSLQAQDIPLLKRIFICKNAVDVGIAGEARCQ